MGEKQQQQHANQKKKNENQPPNVVALKADDCHCNGCASKLIHCIRSLHGLGVETVAIGEDQRIIITGKVNDPTKLLEAVERKTRKKLELIWPKPKSDAKSNNDNHKSDDEKISEEKEPPPQPATATTTSLKINLHCDGCIQRISRTISRAKGYEGMKINEQEDLVIVTGTMDVKALVELLRKQLKKNVEIVKNKGNEKAAEKKVEEEQPQQMCVHPYPLVYGSCTEGDPLEYNPYPPGSYDALQMFSDENVNWCVVM